MNATEAAAWLAGHGGPERTARWVREHVPGRSAKTRRYWWTIEDLEAFVAGSRRRPRTPSPVVDKPARSEPGPKSKPPAPAPPAGWRAAFEAEVSS